MKKIILYCLLVTFSGSVIAGDHKAPAQVTGTTKIDHQRAKQLHDEGALFLDTRGKHAYQESRIPNSINLDFKGEHFNKDNFEKIIGDTDQKIVIYCNGEKCLRSSGASEKAIQWGYKNIYYFRGGFPDWINNDYPTE